MLTILCRNCSNETPSPKAGQEHHPIICPECKAVFRLTEKDGTLAPVSPPPRGLPSGTSVNVEGNELIITHRKLSWVHIGLSIVFPMLIFGLFFSDLATAEFLFNPLTWMMFGLAYYALNGYVNRTVVRLNPEQLTVRYRPLPPWQNRQIQVQDISQLYVKQHVQRGKKGSTTTYRLYVKDRNGRNEELASGLDSPEQALFFEQEAERYLGIEDKAVPGQYDPEITVNFDDWHAFAQVNSLHYSPGKLLEGYRVYGNYQGYKVELMAIQPRLSFSAQTRLTLIATDRVIENKGAGQLLSLDEVAKLFAAPLHAGFKLAGKFMKKGFTDAQAKLKAVWEQPNIASICTEMPNMTLLMSNVAAAMDKTKLSTRDMDLLKQYAGETHSDYCTGCVDICESNVGGEIPIGDVMRYLMYARSYGDRHRARANFQKIPLRVRQQMESVDYGPAEKKCPRNMTIGRLMREALDELG